MSDKASTPRFITLTLAAGGKITVQASSIIIVVDYQPGRVGVLLELAGQTVEYIIKEPAEKVGISLNRLK